MDRIEVFTAGGGERFYTAMIRPEGSQFGTLSAHMAMARKYPQWSDRAVVVITDDAGIRRELAAYASAMAAQRAAGVPDWAPAPLSDAGADAAWEQGPGGEPL
jgi:hypothetical protein